MTLIVSNKTNDLKYTARKTRRWLLYNVVNRLIIRPQSPHINPVEDLFGLSWISFRICPDILQIYLEQRYVLL